MDGSEALLPESAVLRKLTRAEEVSQRLADDIAEGKLAPGMSIDETEIASRYGVSRTPVREAIRDLAAMGLVETRPHRSAVVTRPSTERLRDMFEVMAELEATCASNAAVRMRPDERNAMRAIHEQMAQVVRDSSLDRYKLINEQFHAGIYAGSHNAYLAEITTTTRKRLSPFRRAQFLSPGRLAQSYQEHDQILAAIFRADARGAADAMRKHILVVEDTYERMVGMGGE
ncbi:GntR family transcriptional regulator [Devosia pacifica]|nr:GntR family transcriptional regulator [Devosia pacifica]